LILPLLGATTLTAANEAVTTYYGKHLIEGQSIADSFTNGGTDSLALMKNKGVQGMTYAITYRVMGYQSCIGDTLWQYNDPDETTQYRIIDTPVFTP
jgi:hypothetical protein